MNSFIKKLASRSMIGLLAAAIVACSTDSGEPEFVGNPPSMRLMTSVQYLDALKYVFGPGVVTQAEFAPPERSGGLLAIGAARAGVGGSQLEQFQRSAAQVAAQVVSETHRNYQFPCRPHAVDEADNVCASEVISNIGRLLFRRALTEDEIQGYVLSAATAANSLNDFYAGLEVALKGMLISPDFLFVVERVEPDPENPGKMRLDAYSLASRLSYFLWNGAPDDQLLASAESGELHTEDGLALAVDRMLASPRLVEGTRAFFDDMFGFDDFNTLAKDSLIYPSFTNITALAAREQTLRTVIDHLLVQEKDYRDLYTTRSTFINPDLAVLYDMPAPYGWTPYEFPPESLREGLVTHVSFLALHAHPGRSSPTLRGTALRELLLCQDVPPPPPGADFSGFTNPDSHYPTQRERVRAHLEEPSCAGCHRIIDPPGLALENFNGEGRFQLRENGAMIDPSGDLDGIEFENAAGLGQALRDNPALPACLTDRIYSYATGRSGGAERNDLLDYFNERFAAEGYRFTKLLREVALSKSFAKVADDWNPAPVEQEPAGNRLQAYAEQQRATLALNIE